MFSFTLYITTDCNLKCQYCYEDYHNHYQLNEKTLVDSLEFIMNYGDRGKVLIDFLGGEPLLKKNLIYQAVSYIKNNYPEREVKPDEGKRNERKCYGCSHYTGMLTGSISNGRRYGTVREKYSCDYDISICPYAARKV